MRSPRGRGGGVTQTFKWREWSNMGKDQNSKKIPRDSNKTQKIREPKINSPKNPVLNFRALKIAKCNVMR